METNFELCGQETAEVLVTLAQAGCTLDEARAYLQLRDQQAS